MQIKRELDNLNQIIDQHTLESRSAPGGMTAPGSVAREMTPLIVDIANLKRDRSKLGD